MVVIVRASGRDPQDVPRYAHQMEGLQSIAHCILVSATMCQSSLLASLITRWMMIAESQTLRDLHEEARKWLFSHGHEADTEALLRKGREARSNPHFAGDLDGIVNI